MTTIHTLLGEIPVADLGVVDAHDHLFFSSATLLGSELDDAALAGAELRAFRRAGGGTVVQWTPAGLSRRLPDLKQLSWETGVHVIAATGRHRREFYRHPDPVGEDALAQAFINDVNDVENPCGLVKIATGYHHLDSWEAANIHAAAAAHRATGTPIALHLELGTHGNPVAEDLLGRDVPPRSIILGHLGRNPELSYLDDVAAFGTYLCFDGPSRANHRTDWRTPDLIEHLVEDGRIDQILLGGDTTTAAARSVTGGPGMSGLLSWANRVLGPRIGADALDIILRENPRGAFSARQTATVAAVQPRSA